ncbi:hypothetical protein IAD21_03271 [Abditibacteriota bacterium]|nr:hypothetical protein IAD21_03271 [Abditibacteriota bacterium]
MNKRPLWRRVVLAGALLYLLWFVFLSVRLALQGEFFLLSVLPFFIGFFVVFYCVNLKRVLMAAFSFSFNHRPASPDEFALLDLPELERLTGEWEALGFVRRGDFGWYSANTRLGTSFSRLFEHQSEGAIVEVLQQFTPLKTLPFTSLIESFWGERDGVLRQAHELERATTARAPLAAPTPTTPAPQAEETSAEDFAMWALVTHNRASNRYFPLLRHPRILGARLDANTSTGQMWQLHQERSALVEARLGQTTLRGDLSTLIHAFTRIINESSARRVRATPAWKLARLSLNRKPAPPIYDGELSPLK